MRSVLVEGELSNADVVAVLQQAGADQLAAASYAFGTTRVSLLVGQKFFFRSSGYVGVVVVATSDGRVQRIDVSYAGGGRGMIDVQWGAGDDLELSVYQALMGRLRELALRSSEVPPADAPLPSEKPGTGSPP